MKKLLALCLALMLCLSASFAFGEDDPAAVLSEGRWTYSFFVEGRGDFTFFFHFYQDVPGYGQVFYAGFANNGVAQAGTWTVEAAEKEYAVYMTRGDQEMKTGTAPYTVSFYGFDGALLGQCGFDGEYLYHDMEMGSGAYASPNGYAHDADASQYPSIYEGEKGIAILDFVSPEDPTSTLAIYHNGTYLDMVGIMVEGNWAMEQADDGTRTYTLTPFEDTDTPAVVNVAADGKSAHYVNEDEDEMDLAAVQTGPAVAYTFKGTYTITAYGVDAGMSLILLDDKTCELTADVMGRSATIDTGAWTLGEDGYTITFNFAKALELTSELNMETYLPELHYVQAGSDIGDIDTVLTLVKE